MANPSADQILRIRRLAIGDATNTMLLSDADITAVFTAEGAGSVPETAARCCEMLAVRVGAVMVKWQADGETIDRTMQPDELRKRAREIRAMGLDANGDASTSALTSERPRLFALACGKRGR